MTRPLSRRVSKLEARSKPPAPRPPHVLTMRHGESRADTLRRFAERHGPLPRGHNFLTVPEQPRSPEEEADADDRIERQQAALIAEGQRYNEHHES